MGFQTFPSFARENGVHPNSILAGADSWHSVRLDGSGLAEKFLADNCFRCCSHLRSRQQGPGAPAYKRTYADAGRWSRTITSSTSMDPAREGAPRYTAGVNPVKWNSSGCSPSFRAPQTLILVSPPWAVARPVLVTLRFRGHSVDLEH
jgi:hypothetical protein